MRPILDWPPDHCAVEHIIFTKRALDGVVAQQSIVLEHHEVAGRIGRLVDAVFLGRIARGSPLHAGLIVNADSRANLALHQSDGVSNRAALLSGESLRRRYALFA